MEDTPARFGELMWLLEHVGVPAAVGLVVGVLVRSLIKSVFVLGLLAVGVVIVMAKMGVNADEQQVEQAKSIVPTIAELSGALWRLLRSSPAAVIGLAVGVVMRERWRHKS